MLHLIHKQWDLIKSHQMQLQTAMHCILGFICKPLAKPIKSVFVQYFYFK